jgi:hypothetical protein
MSDFIPGSDSDFSVWTKNFITYANANLAALGLVAADLTPITAADVAFNTALATNVSAQSQAQSARISKDGARRDLENFIRPLAARIQTTPTVSDAHRESLQLTVRSTTRTAVGAPETRPVATIDTSQRLQHTISFGDETTPNSRAKPPGAQGCEIWVKVGGEAPVDPSELKYVATDTRTPYLAHYEGADGGKIAYYMLRWISTRGETGPWSQTVSATITA